MKLIIPTHNK
uniref:Uncharacterized protein n=1 Tax=Anguilla anguilla TaxID=7936 RepID=A0A0E9VL85_ANGAN